MSLKWTGNHSESGILRKSEFKEKKEELFVFGYSCKLFRNDDRALHIDQGKHLIPWMGDETLKIDRYDARGALHELSRFEAPPGGYDWRVELTKSEHEVEQLCDEERYRALHTDEDEELMYKEEELKRLHAAGYGQVGFNYEAGGEPPPPAPPTEVDDPFLPEPAFKALFQEDVLMPDTQKQNAIIEKTAKFIAAQGVQMEILIKAKQGDNPQFKFLNKGDQLHPYYVALTALVKAGKWPEKEPEIIEEKPPEHDEYLHPSLASTIIESAPSIPSIHYKPSADCDYTMLISKMRGDGEGAAALAPGELPPPGTEPPQYAPRAYSVQVLPPVAAAPAAQPPPPQMRPLAEPPRDSTGLSLMKHYGSGTDTEHEDSEEESASNDKPASPLAVPPDDVKLFIDKMSTYVARNGDAFADIVRAKNDPRFSFLDPADVYHPYYNRIMREKRGEEVNGAAGNKVKPPVSFSIKKMKEPDPILPKPALPYESSSDEDPEKQADKQTDKQENEETLLKPVQHIPSLFSINTMPQALIYKMEGHFTHNLPIIQTIDPTKPFMIKPPAMTVEIREPPKPERVEVERVYSIQSHVVDKTEQMHVKEEKPLTPIVEKIQEIKIDSNENNKKDVKEINRKADKDNNRKDVKETRKDVKERESREREENSDYKKDKKRHKDRREYRSKSENRERRSRSRDREKRRDKDRDRDKKRKKVDKDELESEIISLEDNSDDMIDLTGDLSDSKGEGESEAEKAKQLERRRRAAEFLKKVGVEPRAAAAALPNNSLASAMVETLESMRRKKAAEDKRRRKEKRRRREKRDYEESERSHRKSKRRKYKSSDDNEESDYESPKKKKRKKEKKTSKKKKRRYEVEEEEEQQLPNIDLSNTLKELRNNSPTKNLLLPDIGENVADDSSTEDEREDRRMKKKQREYSEGEWSSDSEADSRSTADRLKRSPALD